MRRRREPGFRGDNICCRCSLFSAPTVFYLFIFSSRPCLFPGELFRRWGSHLGQMETSISHNKQEDQRSIRVELSSPASSHVPPPALHYTCMEPVDNLRSHSIKHVTASLGLS